MNRLRNCLVTACLFMAQGLWAAPWQGTCVTTFHVSATMHSFDGSAATIPFTLPDGGDCTLVIPVDSMSTGNAKRDAEMHHMLHGDAYPEIAARLHGGELRALASGAAVNTGIPFTLTIAGVSRNLDAVVRDLSTQDERLEFDATFDVSLADFQLRAPSVMKMVRVHDTVAVTAHVLLTR